MILILLLERNARLAGVASKGVPARRSGRLCDSSAE
jgi:hypothetical protein